MDCIVAVFIFVRTGAAGNIAVVQAITDVRTLLGIALDSDRAGDTATGRTSVRTESSKSYISTIHTTSYMHRPVYGTGNTAYAAGRIIRDADNPIIHAIPYHDGCVRHSADTADYRPMRA